ATNVSVEIATEQRRQVTVLGIPEDQLLGLYRAGGVYVKLQAVRVPAPQVLDSIWIDMALEVALLIPVLPDHALQRLERRDLAIFTNPGLQLVNERIGRLDGNTAQGRHLLQLSLHLRIASAAAHELGQMARRIGKQHLVHERDAA